MFEYKCKLTTAVTIGYISSCLIRDANESTNNQVRIQVLPRMPVRKGLPVALDWQRKNSQGLCTLSLMDIVRCFFGKGESSGQIDKITHINPPSCERDTLGIVSVYLEPGEDKFKIIVEIKLNVSKERDMLISY